jgi:LacI family transcriptional regulator
MVMTPRIIDIAKEASVSQSAVSLALNNKPGISDEVRRKIIAIAERLEYRNSGSENIAIKGMAIKLIKIAKHGHIVNEWHNAFISEYMEGIEKAAKKRKAKFEVSFFDRVPIEEIISAHRKAAIDGLIVLGTELNAYELNFFAEITKPIVFIDTYFPLSVYDCIDMDNVDGVFKAVQHLYSCGHRKIGLVKSSIETRNFRMRENGFREAMEYFSLPVKENYIVSVDPTYHQSIADMGKYLNKASSLPTAFFCMNDIMAYGCMKALRDHNRRIPDDVSVIGFDDLPSSGISDPPLTTIRVSSHKIGQRALEKLIEHIRNPEDHIPENILISGKLVTRNSVRLI